ncbi:hypothetical protein [Streptomyces sp. OUCMDZ-3434]|uniref:hypothetical protein n=1 Tax=Streptomyces sp. OUCMDZ-3434 TaxID=1535304 RepID=UPI001E4D64DC|nr:hypothetical protein [Streptomyces sp. OUCMDZ-3434]
MSTCRRSRACYLAGCRNEPCKAAAYQYSARLQLDHIRGQYRLIDATQTRVWIHRLIAHGWSRAQIASASGIPVSTVSGIAGSLQKTSRRNAAAIQSIRLAPPRTGMIDATGTRRRIRALMVLGHRLVDIEDASGVDRRTAQTHAAGRHTTIHADLARQIAGAYRNLMLTPGASDRTRGLAAARGWHGPLAWGDIDDPACEPEIDERPAGPGRPEQIDDERVQHLVRDGHSNTQIAVRLGCSKRAVERSRRRTKQKETAA